jgi:hypothetical protein
MQASPAWWLWMYRKIAAQIQDKASDIDWHDFIHGIHGSDWVAT